VADQKTVPTKRRFHGKKAGLWTQGRRGGGGRGGEVMKEEGGL